MEAHSIEDIEDIAKALTLYHTEIDALRREIASVKLDIEHVTSQLDALTRRLHDITRLLGTALGELVFQSAS